MERVTTLLYVICSLVIMNEVLFVQSDGKDNFEKCNQTSDSNVNVICDKRKQDCNCSDIIYYDSAKNDCFSVNQTLRGVNITRKTDSLTFRWAPMSFNMSNMVCLFPKKIAKETYGNSSVTFEELEPGTEFTFKVYSTVILPNNTCPMYITHTDSVRTKPAKPGPVILVEDHSNGYSICFNASRGNVNWYKISVKHPSETTAICETNLQNKTLTYCNLNPGQLYNYNITACNSDSDCSENFKGNFTTSDKKSGPVTKLEVNVQSPSEASLMWKPPSESNGKILHYLLTVASLGGDSNPCVFYVDDQTCKANETSNDRSSYQCLDRLNCTMGNKNYQDNFSAIVSGLKICTNYSVNITAVNKAGPGHEINRVFTTKPDVAAAVPTVNINSSRNENTGQIALSAWWNPSPYENETTYTVTVNKTLNRSSEDLKDLISEAGYLKTLYSQENVLAYWRYKVCVQAKICKKYDSPSNCSDEITTQENNPGTVLNLTVRQHEQNAQNFTLHFTCLSETEQNGIIRGYIINKTQADEIQPQTEIIELNPTSCNNDYTSGGLVVGKNYTFAVMARNDRYNGSYSNPVSLRVKPGKPLLVERNGLKIISGEEAGHDDTDSEVVISVCIDCLLDSSQGEVVKAGLLVCVLSDVNFCNMTGEQNFSAIGTWGQSEKTGFKERYRTTNNNWLINLKSGEGKSQDFKVGVDSNCKSEPNITYCNGPYPRGREFEVSAIVCTDGGCTEFNYDKKFVKKASEDSHPETHVALALGTLVATVLLGVLIYLVLRQMAPQMLERICEWSGKSVSYVPEKRFNRPVKIKDFEKHVQKLHRDSNLLFQAEFESIKKISSNFKRSSDEAKKESNRVKNRYVDILPYDHSRVKLDVQPEEDETNDFINANYIPGYNSVREYIATQGPMPFTVVDFWRMLWEQKSQVIVMLSDLQENGKLKVDQYWPDTIDEPVNFGNVVVELTNFSQMNKFIIRNFKVSKGDDVRKLTQFFLPGWWDFSANLCFVDVIEFVKLIRQETTPEPSGPIIVHCSAGVGRTGTLIALDYFIQYVEEHSLDEYVDIFSYVLSMRKNRPRMVQAESQYIFIYDAVLDIIKQKIARETADDLKEVLTSGRLTLESPQKPCICLDVQDTEEGKCVYTNKALELENPNSEHDNPAPEHKNSGPALDNQAPKLDNPASELDNPASELDNPAPKLDNPASELDNPAPHKVRFMNEYSSLGSCSGPELVSFDQK